LTSGRKKRGLGAAISGMRIDADCALRSETGSPEFGYFPRYFKMVAPRALVFRPLVKGSEALGTRLHSLQFNGQFLNGLLRMCILDRQSYFLIDLTSTVKHLTVLQTHFLNTKSLTFFFSVQRLSVIVVLILRRNRGF